MLKELQKMPAMEENYALFVLKREQQLLSLDTQLRGPGPCALFDHRVIYLDSLGNAIDLIQRDIVIRRRKNKKQTLKRR